MSGALVERAPAGSSAGPAAAAELHRNEFRTRVVVGFTFLMMVAELVAGTLTGSLALLADGWHMSSHVAALGLSALAYWYARVADHSRFAFGPARVYPLAGYTSAVLLIVVAFEMMSHAVERLVTPQVVAFDEALPVAALGFLVNVVSAFMLHQPNLGAAHDGGHHHHHGDGHHHHHHDHTLRAAYLHVVADALTSILAILALLAGRYLGWTWADAAVAIIGSVVILRWSAQLSSDCAGQLLDVQPGIDLARHVREALERVDGATVEELRLWQLGAGRLVLVAAVQPGGEGTLSAFREAAMKAAPLAHVTLELRPRAG